jgi:uncharacterized membrane protein YhiD involved in acid resistance
MSVNLNLLPPELSISKDLRRILTTLKALGVIAMGAFLVFAVVIGAIFIVSNITLGSAKAKVNALKSQVAAQEKSEQQIVLLEDRLTKIGSVQKIPNSLASLITVEPFLTKFSGSVSVNQMQITPIGTTLSLNIKTNSDLTSLLTSIQNSDAFKSVELTSFSFNPTVGYSVEVAMVNK